MEKHVRLSEALNMHMHNIMCIYTYITQVALLTQGGSATAANLPEYRERPAQGTQVGYCGLDKHQ